MGRGQGIDLVHKMDPLKPSDLKRWLTYVDMTEDEFDRVADTFRDPRVWRMGAAGLEKDELGGLARFSKQRAAPPAGCAARARGARSPPSSRSLMPSASPLFRASLAMAPCARPSS